jgi:glycosyltransferase involved in cell wall biosynthesis
VLSADTRRPRTVVHVLGTAHARGTAQARIVAALTRALDPERYRLRAWFLDEPGPLIGMFEAAGVPPHMVTFRGPTDPVGVFRVAQALRRDRPKIVHLHVGGRSRLWLLQVLSSAKRVAHLHGDHTEAGAPLALASFVRGADAAIATSRAVAAVAPGGATVIYPGVEIPDSEASVQGRRPMIGAVGRLEPVKGLTILLEAAASLRNRYPDLRVELAGSGTCEPRLRSLAAQLGLDAMVRFLGWRADVDALHRRWQAFAQPSVHEGFGLAALEAMAAGLPVVASAAGGLPELVEDGRTGFLVPVDSVEALADRLGRLLEDERLRARMGGAARRRVHECFSVDEMAARTAKVYDELLDE